MLGIPSQINVVAVKNRNKFSIIRNLIFLFQGMFKRKDGYNHFALEILYKIPGTEVGISYHLAEYMDATLKDGVSIKGTQKFSDHYEQVICWPNIGDPAKFQDFADKYEGKKYAGEQLFGYLFITLNLWKNNLLGSNDKRIICSELVALWFKENGIEIQDSDFYDLISTEEILRKISPNNYTRVK